MDPQSPNPGSPCGSCRLHTLPYPALERRQGRRLGRGWVAAMGLAGSGPCQCSDESPLLSALVTPFTQGGVRLWDLEGSFQLKHPLIEYLLKKIWGPPKTKTRKKPSASVACQRGGPTTGLQGLQLHLFWAHDFIPKPVPGPVVSHLSIPVWMTKWLKIPSSHRPATRPKPSLESIVFGVRCALGVGAQDRTHVVVLTPSNPTPVHPCGRCGAGGSAVLLPALWLGDLGLSGAPGP